MISLLPEQPAASLINLMRVHITKKLVIWLNNDVCDKLRLNEYTFVRVMCFEPYDEILIQPRLVIGNGYDPCLYRVKSIRDNGMNIFASDLIIKLSIGRKVIGRYRPVWDEVHEVLRIKLNERMKNYG